MSLLREIQSDLANECEDVSRVLRKCKILAARLGSAEFAHWVDWELDGYPVDKSVPDYRCLSITYYASFMNHGWRIDKAPVPLQIIPEKYRDNFRFREFKDGIAKASSFMREKTVVMIQRPDLVPALQGRMYPEMNCHGFWGEVPSTEFKQLVSTVKNRILDFSLRIEAENACAGEALPNTEPVPMGKLQPMVQNIFYGSVGNVAQNSNNVSQVSTNGITPEDLRTLVEELTQHLHELGLNERQQQRAEAQIAALRAELRGEPDTKIVSQSAATLRNITEGAIASLLATAVQPSLWHWILKTLERL